MAIDPNALLIFKAREDDQPDDQQKKKGKKDSVGAESALPGSTSEAALPSPKQSHKRRRTTKQNVPLRLKIKEKEVQQEGLAPTSIYRDDIQTNPQQTVNVYANNEYVSKKVEASGKAQQSREAARGRNCVWHPWREAFAVCTYCHRPFCFEDTMEYGNEYYCLEDIDYASSTYKEKLAARGNTIGVASGVLLLLGFLAFFYFSNGQVIYVAGYLYKVGLPYFLGHINYSYTFALIDSIIMVLGFVTAILVFTQHDNAFILGMLVCLSSVAIFSYQYISTFTTYFILLDTLMLFGFITLLISRTSTGEVRESAKLISSSRAQENRMVRWPNVGKF
jgi:hypothetical protein